MNFQHLKIAIAAQFKRMQAGRMFRVKITADGNDVTKDRLWETYLGAFTPETNPTYRERTEHDCSCCRQFVKALGDVVSVVNGEVLTLWDVTVKDEPGYQPVVDAMARLVRAAPIADAFLHFEGHAGADKSFEQLVSGGVQQWNHFHASIPAQYVKRGADIPSALGVVREAHQVAARGLRELTLASADTVLDLVAQNSLYRGAEHKFAVDEWRKIKVRWDALPAEKRDAFVWDLVSGPTSGAAHGIRNTAIGTLLIDLSADEDLEVAVKKFEAKVGAANYKRPTALVTQKMIDQAKDKVQELGLTTALQRRHATLADISVTNVLFADRSARKAMADAADPFGGLAPSASVKASAFDRVEEVTIDKFLADILPRAETLEVLFENAHAPRMVSLVAPADPTAPNLFKWDNGFSWSYAGEFADSIKERVKAAGGNVTGDLCCRLAWEYTDDLDFHMREPGGDHIYFGAKSSPAGGRLDVDANGGGGMMKHPVENIAYPDRAKMKEGTYQLSVNNWSRRSDGVGFEVEIDALGEVHHFAYEKVLGSSQTVQIAEIDYTRAGGFVVRGKIPSTTASRDAWGLKTQDFRRVNAVMLSPNHWDGQVGAGNKHFFFMLDGAVNDGTARGFFNEFLKPELDAHRKVLEMVGGKLKLEPVDASRQLSGLGFSSTAGGHLICRLTGSFTRTIKVVF